MATLGLVDDWEGNIAAIYDKRLRMGPLALQFYEGFPTPFLDTVSYTCPRPDWQTEDLPTKPSGIRAMFGAGRGHGGLCATVRVARMGARGTVIIIS